MDFNRETVGWNDGYFYVQAGSLVVSIFLLLRMMAFQPELDMMMGTISLSMKNLISFGVSTQMIALVRACACACSCCWLKRE